MKLRRTSHSVLVSIVALLLVAAQAPLCRAGELLIADRLTNSVYRYSPGGDFVGVLLTDNVNLNQPSGLQVSPDRTKLYVASSQGNNVIEYDYDYAAGTATNPSVFADATDGLMFPSSILFSQDGDTMYVSNLGGTGIAQFNTDGTSAGAAINGAIAGGSIFQYSGLAFAPGGELLVGGFQDFPAGTAGAIARSDAAISTISDFIAADATLNGASSLVVDGNDLYVTAGFAGRVNKYDATTGTVDPGFTPVTGLAFPASMIPAPDGNGLLVGILGIADGAGNISRFGFDGTPLGEFAPAESDPANGFQEATAMVFVVPEPSSMILLMLSFVLPVFIFHRRFC